MRLPWKRKSSQPKTVRKPRHSASFGGNLEDITVLRQHALRALCGFLMDRHSACRSPHPFCATHGHQKIGEPQPQLIAEAIPQRSPRSSGPADIIGIYLSQASAAEGNKEETDIWKFVTHMVPADPVPNHKLVVSAPQDGTYQALFGPILNPTEGDYSTGSIDSANARQFNYSSEPRHCRWQYWESALPKGDWLVARFHCLQVFGEWWIVEMDWGGELVQQVAALEFTDNPEHNFGIHARPGIYSWVDDGSEFSKVIKENLPPLL